MSFKRLTGFSGLEELATDQMTLGRCQSLCFQGWDTAHGESTYLTCIALGLSLRTTERKQKKRRVSSNKICCCCCCCDDSTWIWEEHNAGNLCTWVLLPLESVHTNVITTWGNISDGFSKEKTKGSKITLIDGVILGPTYWNLKWTEMIWNDQVSVSLYKPDWLNLWVLWTHLTPVILSPPFLQDSMNST